MDKDYVGDFKEECGCYAFGDMCYDRQGEFTHTIEEECNN